MISQFYVLFNFLCGKSVLHKRAAKENAEKVDSFHIYILASTWKWTNYQREPKEKLGKSFRKLILWQALLQKCPGKVLLWLQTPSIPAGLGSSALVLVLVPLWAPDPPELWDSSGQGPGLLAQTWTHIGLGPQHEIKPQHEHEIKTKAKAKNKPKLNLNLNATQLWPEPSQNPNPNPKPSLNQTQSWAQPKHKPELN